MKRLYNFKALMAIAMMFLMTTAVFAQATQLSFQIRGTVTTSTFPLGSHPVGPAGDWTASQGTLFTDANEGSHPPTQVNPSTADLYAGPGNVDLADCLAAPAQEGSLRTNAGANLYTFQFTYTSVSELTLRFVAGITGSAANNRSIAQIRTGSSRNNLTVHTAATTTGTFINPQTALPEFLCTHGVVTISNLNVPAGTFIEITLQNANNNNIAQGNAMFVEAVVTPIPPPSGEPSLALDRIEVAEADLLPGETFTGVGPFTHMLRRTMTESPEVTIYAQTPDYVTITASHGLEGTPHSIASGDYFYIGMPDGVYTDTIVFRVTGTAGDVIGQTATYLVIFEKDTVNIAIANVVPANETAIPAAGNIVVTFNKDVFVLEDVDMDEIVTINGEAVTVTLAGRVLTIPYTVADWDNLGMDVVIMQHTLRDAVYWLNDEIALNFTQNMANPAITGATVGGANLQGATGLQTSFTVNLQFNRTDVVRNLEVPITLNGTAIPAENIVGTTIQLSGLSFATPYAINVPAGAFVVETNTTLVTQEAFAVNFTTAAFQVPLAGYRSITGGNFRAMRRIVTNDSTGVQEWARGPHAYSGDSIWFFRYAGDPLGFVPHAPNTGTENATVAGNGLFESMLSPVRFSGGAIAYDLPFDDGVHFLTSPTPQKIRMMHNGARQFIIRTGSTDITELALNMIHNTATQAAGTFAPTYISEIVISNNRLALVDNDPQADGVDFFTELGFYSTPVEIRGSGSIPANGGPFMLIAYDLSQTIPQGSFIRLTIEGGQNPEATNPLEASNQVLVEALFTPSPEFLEASYLITSVTQTNAAGAAIHENQNMPTEFIASVNFGSNSLVQRNRAVAITLNGAPIEEGDISHTFVTLADLAEATNYTLVMPAGAWISVADPSWVSPAQNIAFRTSGETSIRPDVPAIAAETVSIFPNPVSDVLYVTAENMQSIEIMDMLGRTVLQKATNNSRQSVDVSGLREGLYFIRITKTTGETVVMRFVKN